MKKVCVFLIVLFFCRVTYSTADQDVYLQSEAGMPNRGQIIETVKEFFSMKCNIPYSEFNSISFDMVLLKTVIICPYGLSYFLCRNVGDLFMLHI